jgi:signal peptide peptidase SppA
MTDLDLALRTPGRILLLKRGEAQALLDRALEARPARNGSWLTNMWGGLTGRSADRADEEKPSEALAMPSIRWASDVVYGEGYALVDGVAIIDIIGVMTPEGYFDWWSWEWVPGYAQIAEAVDAARLDGRVKAIFLRGNSPGGLVDGCFDAADQIRLGNGEAGGKPIWAHVRMACSAAYALVSGCDRIVASEEADVGSIGVVITHVDSSAMYAEWGLKVEAIESAPHKTDAAGWKPLTEEARAHLKAVVDQVAKRFVSVVSAGRALSEDDIRAQEARWYLAQHDDPTISGLALGLVDEIGSERAAFAALVASLSDSSDTNMEIEMSLKDQITALRTKASAGDAKALAELKALGVPVSAETSNAEDEGEDTSDEGEEADDEAEGEGDEEPKASASGTKAGFALVGSKAAKGREALAAKLGEKVAMGSLTYGDAMGMLTTAPKASSLAAAMSGRDRNIGGDGGKEATGLGAAVDRLNAKRAGKK